MKKNIGNIMVLTSVTVGCFLLSGTIAFAEVAAAVRPPNVKGSIVAVIIAAIIFYIAVILTKVIVTRGTKKSNIVQLNLLSRNLFDSFNGLIEEGGLFEEAWDVVSGGDEERDEKFQGMINRARKIMADENMEKTLIIFEEMAKKLLASSKMVPMHELDECEEIGFSRMTNLMGVDYARKEFLEMVTLLHIPSYLCSKVIGHYLALKFAANRVCIGPFQLLIEANRENFHSVFNQGVLQIINDIALFIYIEGCREKTEVS